MRPARLLGGHTEEFTVATKIAAGEALAGDRLFYRAQEVALAGFVRADDGGQALIDADLDVGKPLVAKILPVATRLCALLCLADAIKIE